MQFLYEKGIASIGDSTKRDVIQQGPLDSVKWFIDHDVIEDQRDFSWAINCAAEFGRLDVLQLFQTLDEPGGYEAVGLKRRRTGQVFSLWGGERDTFYWAAGGGHMGALEWLQTNYLAKCGVDAMDVAASGGHLDAVKWLHANRTEGCTSDAMYRAAENGHFEMVKWLYENRPESRTCLATVKAFQSGHFLIAYWLHFKIFDYKFNQYSVEAHKRLVFASNVCGKPLEALRFLREIYPSISSASFVKKTRENCTGGRRQDVFTASLVLRWLEEN